MAIVLLVGPWLAPRLAAQLSPGELSQPHAGLEGSANCPKCHEPRRGVTAQRCLACHTLLGERLAAGAGLHAQAGYERCESCHVEHHGRRYDLVWWGEGQEESGFDHRQAGYELEGAHRGLACRDCHQASHMRDPQALTSRGKDTRRTFLGLRRESCLDCHADQHRGQLAGTCLSCHGMDAWKPASGFDHARTAFPLTGRHRQVACTLCHASQAGPGDAAGSVRYSGVAFARCLDCHRDPHDNRFGAQCQRCHATSGWQDLDRSQIDHDRTRYPLVGRHRQLDCGGCHRGSTYRVARYAACTDCHADSHLGQLTGGASGGRCETCHVVAGFRPARFSLADHQSTSYPLAGAHRAVPCSACHRTVSPSELPPPAGSRASFAAAAAKTAETIQFRFTSPSCLTCHGDPHRGDVDRYVAAAGCESCHTVETWRQVSFDHDRTRFALTGGHRGVGCARCHLPVEGEDGGRLALSGTATACAACHADPHRGQFGVAGGAGGCERCHGVESFRPARFVHDRDSSFRLAGAHARVPCAGCHRAEVVAGEETMVRYRPLPATCEACHGGAGEKTADG